MLDNYIFSNSFSIKNLKIGKALIIAVIKKYVDFKRIHNQ